MRSAWAEIAKAVGIKAPSLYNHFPSKQAIFDAILETTSASSWSRWPSGSAKAASGPSSTAANAAASSISNRVAADDNPMLLMSFAVKPLASPPFPLDYVEEMTALMGGDGRMPVSRRRNCKMDYIRVTKENIDKEHICCAMSGKQSLAKKEWLKQRFAEGLVFYRSAERGKCFIEYIPAENAWVPIEAAGWLYINCLWVSGSLKGHGYSSELLEECLRDAKAQGKNGVCILCAEGRKREFSLTPSF